MKNKLFIGLVLMALLNSCMTISSDSVIVKKPRSTSYYLIESDDPLNIGNIIQNEFEERGYVINRIVPGGRIPNNPVNDVESTGSGFIVSKHGYIMTSAHVIGDSEEVIVEYNGKEYDASVVVKDKNIDVAILHIELDSISSFISLCALSKQNSGDKIYAIGFPLNSVLGNEPRITDGIISAKTGLNGNSTYFQFSAPVQPGNSGGPVINEMGKAIGVIAAKLSDEYTYQTSGSIPQNVNFAVKSEYPLMFFEEFIDKEDGVTSLEKAISCCVLVRKNNHYSKSIIPVYAIQFRYTYMYDVIHYTITSIRINIIDPDSGQIINCHSR